MENQITVDPSEVSQRLAQKIAGLEFANTQLTVALERLIAENKELKEANPPESDTE